MSKRQEENAISMLCTLRHTIVLPQDTKEKIRNTLAWLRWNLSLLSVKDVQAFFDRMYEEIRNIGDAELVQRVSMLGRLVANDELIADAYMSAMIMLLGTEYFCTKSHRLIN